MDSNNAAAATADLATNCFTCAPLDKYISLTNGFADNLSSALNEPMLIVFASLAGLWFVVFGIKLALHLIDIGKLAEGVVYISITAVILGSQANGLISYVYTSSLSIMGSAADVAFQAAGAGGAPVSVQGAGLVRLAATGEAAVAKVIQAASAIASAGALYNLQNYVYAVILVVPWFLLVVSYSSQIAVAIFRVMMIAILAPFLFMAFAFGWGRSMTFSGSRSLLGAIVVLFCCTAALALAVYGVNQVPLDPADLHGDALNKFASISNPEFLVILFLGIAGTALTTEGVSVANSAIQTAFTNTAAGIMTAGASAAAFFGIEKARGLAGAIGNRALKNLNAGRDGNKPSEGAQDLLKKFNDINKPGNGAE